MNCPYNLSERKLRNMRHSSSGANWATGADIELVIDITCREIAVVLEVVILVDYLSINRESGLCNMDSTKI